MDDEEEKLFLERLTLKVWKARREGSVVGAAYVLGVGFLLYLIIDVGPVDPMSSFLYAGIGLSFGYDSATPINRDMKTMRFWTILVLISATPLASFAGIEDSYDKTTDYKKIGWMDKGMASAKAKLKDPGSAQFRGVYYHSGSDGIPVTCGEVNSKNSFGGYGGYQKFISAGSADLTFLEEQVADFYNLWNTLCRG